MKNRANINKWKCILLKIKKRIVKKIQAISCRLFKY